jgi:hypothetical protein
MIDLNSLIDPLSGWELTGGYAINDAGQITGSGRIGGQSHAFLLTPVPEPSAWVALASSTAVLVPLRTRLRKLTETRNNANV